jgi:hypothetical protein
MKIIVPFILILAAGGVCCFAQESVSAGGKWIRVVHVDKKTDRASVSFVLAADTGNPDRHAVISITCDTPTKPPLSVFNADVLLAPTVRDPMNYYSPALRVEVKVDDQKIYKPTWDMVPSLVTERKRMSLDNKTIRNLLTGSTMRVRFRDHYDESYLDEFSIGGLNVNDLRETCGSKWFGKEEPRAPREMAAEKAK